MEESTEEGTAPPAPSPYAPGIPTLQWAWDSTCLKTLDECPRKYYYTHILQYQGGSSIHLDFGHELHSVLEHFDHDLFKGIDREEAIRAGTVRALAWDDLKHVSHPDYGLKNRHTLARTFIWYTDHFNPDPAETVALENGEPAVELSFQTPPIAESHIAPGTEYILTGHLDRLVNWQENYWVHDRKTTKSSLQGKYGEKFKQQWSPDIQMTLYTLATKIVLDKPAAGVIVDAVQLQANSSDFLRFPVRRTDEDLDEFLEDTAVMLAENERYVEENRWPGRPSSCDRFGGCPFRPVCQQPASRRHAALEQHYRRREKPWNPLEPR